MEGTEKEQEKNALMKAFGVISAALGFNKGDEEQPVMKADDFLKKLEESNAKVIAEMKAYVDSKVKVEDDCEPAGEGEEQEAEKEEIDEAPTMKADEVISNIEKLEEAGVTPAARKKAIAEMKAGEFCVETFLKTADKVEKDIDLNEDQDIDHIAKMKTLEGGERSKYFNDNYDAIMKQQKEQA